MDKLILIVMGLVVAGVVSVGTRAAFDLNDGRVAVVVKQMVR